VVASAKDLFVNFLQTYPYLFFSLMLFCAALTCLVLVDNHRKPTLLCGVLAAPAAVLEIFFVPDYWHPVRLSTFIIGVEDILFSFSVGIIACTLAYAPFRGSYSWTINLPSMMRRYALVFLPFLAGLLVLRQMGIPVMAAALFGMLGIALLLKKPMKDIWPASAVGAISFSLVYFILIKAGFTLWPHWLQQWNIQNLTGYHGFGVPLEELAWAFLYGAVHPCAMGYILGFKLHSDSPAAVPARGIFSPRDLTASANLKEAGKGLSRN
jgi:hypothetical protein